MSKQHVMEMGVNVRKLNEDIALFPQVTPITEEMNKLLKGVSRLVMLDRYAFKDTAKNTLSEGDFVILTVKEDPKFPARGMGYVLELNREANKAKILVEEEFRGVLEGEEAETGIVTKSIDVVEKPLELYWEQIAHRNARGLSETEATEELRKKWFNKFYKELVEMNFIPAGRVLYGAGSGSEVTYFNCYVMPYVKDSRGGISDHRKQVMEIMSRGGKR